MAGGRHGKEERTSTERGRENRARQEEKRAGTVRTESAHRGHAGHGDGGTTPWNPTASQHARADAARRGCTPTRRFYVHAARPVPRRAYRTSRIDRTLQAHQGGGLLFEDEELGEKAAPGAVKSGARAAGDDEGRVLLPGGRELGGQRGDPAPKIDRHVLCTLVLPPRAQRRPRRV
ncbi:hypothetical protein C8J57DRAFT_1713525 [Mycena rebaudengoi]|nr:hypothetical protein C8J57DRAFT_1713525 [Mycena rebaudengoi]